MKYFWMSVVILVPVALFAQSPSPSVTPVPFPSPADNPALISTLSGLLSLARGWQSLGLYAALAMAVKLLVDLSKLSIVGAPFEKIPERYRLAVVTGAGTVIVALGFMAAHIAVPLALVSALGSAVGASFVHELIADFFPGSSGSA